MNKILKRILQGLIVLLAFCFCMYAVFAAHSCTLVGNYYDCDSANDVSGDVDFGDKGVWIHDTTITILGANGVSGDRNGVNGQLSIESDGRVLIENMTISITGGAGYSQEDYDGGNGGLAIFDITGDGYTVINDTIITLQGGAGANGDADCDGDDCSSGENGGMNGYITIELSSKNLTTDNLTITATSGNVGNSDSHCEGDDEDGQTGVTATDNTILINNTNTTLHGTFQITGGNGGEADDCGDGRGGNGGGGGSNIITIESGIFINNMNITSIGGDGNDASVSDAANDGGDSGGTELTITSTSSTLNSNYVCTPGAFGYGAGNGDGGVDNDGIVGACETEITTTDITITGDFTYSTVSTGECSDADDGDETCTGDSGNECTFIINATDQVVFNTSTLSIKSNSGNYPAGTDYGTGGNGGDITFNILSNKTIVDSSIFTITSAEGENCDGDSGAYHNGYGGNIDSTIGSEVYIEDSTITYTSGESGQGSDCATAAYGGSIILNGSTKFDMDDSSFIILVGKNSPTASSAVGGYIDSTINNLTMTNSIFNQHIGSFGSSNGKYLNTTINNRFILTDSNFSIRSNGTLACRSPYINLESISLFETYDSKIYAYAEGDSGTCDAYLYGSGEEFNFLNNTILELTSDIAGAGKMNLTLSSTEADLPGVIVWNYTETGDAITTNILSNQLVYNSTRGSNTLTGTWSWNETVENVTYDDYFTRIQSTQFVKTSSDAGPEFYNKTYFICQTKVTLGDHLTITPVINFTIYNGTTYFGSDNDTAIVSGSYVNSTTDVSMLDTDIGEIWNCSVDVYTTGFTNQNDSQEEIKVTYPYNVSIYIGNMNSVAGTILNDYLKNATNVTLDRGTINDYIQNNCSTFPCTIPLQFRSDTDALINVTELSIIYGTSNPVNTSITSTTNFPLTFNSSREGWLLVDDIYFIHESDEQTDIRIKGGNEADYISHWISVLYSKFTFNLTPKEVDYYDVYPLWSSQQDVQPWGQTPAISIFNITRMNNTNHSFEIRIGIDNGTGNNCTNIYFSEDNNIANKFEVFEGNYTDLTDFFYNPGECYQESANVSDQTGIDGDCSLKYDGEYEFIDATLPFTNPERMIDGDWDVGGYWSSHSGEYTYVYINYSIPKYANSAIWTYKYQQTAGPPTDVTNNITISEIDYSDNILQLRMNCYASSGICYPLRFQHKVDSSWVTLGTINPNTDLFYEEAIIWEFPETYNNTQLWSWVDFNSCTSEDVRYFFPDFNVKAKAEGTVNTTGFWDDLK